MTQKDREWERGREIERERETHKRNVDQTNVSSPELRGPQNLVRNFIAAFLRGVRKYLPRLRNAGINYGL